MSTLWNEVEIVDVLVGLIALLFGKYIKKLIDVNSYSSMEYILGMLTNEGIRLVC